LTTRIGDVGLLLALFLLFWHAGSLAFRDLEAIRAGLLDVGAPGVLTVISALIFLGAVGKSAQVPLHVWLPDAMEGPTAVSALIHAATMVAAGVYLVARTFVLFTPQTLQGVFAVGLITHLLAGTVALTQTDIKRVLAYSTISQLGLMVLALGLGAVSAALFHLYTHAFFKALLFLAAGSVIHAVGVQDLGQLGGLRRRLPFTAGCFGIAALSMSGLPGLSGFWSKDAILVAARSADPALFWLLCAGAVMTTAYITRLYLRCFHGAERLPAGAHPHEASLAMGLPMAVLAVGAVAAGWVGMPLLNEVFYHGLGEAHAQGEAPRELFILSAGMVLLGSVLAWWVGFKGRALLPTRLRPLAQGWYRVAAARYYADEVYARVVIGPVQALARWGALLDQRLVDGAVNTVGRVFAMLGRFKGWVDRAWIDGAVNGIAGLACGLGELGRGLQSGVIHHYLIAVALAALAVGFWYAV
jgi:NADH-quinone oxidoreductase subunit L